MATKRRSKEEKAFDEKVDRIRSLAIDCVMIDMFKLGKVDEYARKIVAGELSDEDKIKDIREYVLNVLGGRESSVR